MSDPVAFFIPGRPRPQGSKQPMLNRSTGEPYLYESNTKLLTPWRRAVKAGAVIAMGGRPAFDAAVNVSLTFLFARPASHGAGFTLPTGRQFGDIDKLTRAVYDSLTGVVFADDSLVIQETNRKAWAGPGEIEGVHVWANRRA